MNVDRGVIISIPVEYVLVTKDNLQDVAKWCDGLVAGLTFVEFQNIHGRYQRVSIGEFLVKQALREDEPGFLAYSSEDYDKYIIPEK